MSGEKNLLRQLSKALVAVLTVVTVLVVSQVANMAVAHAQETLEKPEVTVVVGPSFVSFDWDAADSDSWGVAVVNGSCTLVDPDAPTVTSSFVSCTPQAGAASPLCVSVKGLDAAGNSSRFSNWRCADTDAFGIDETGAGYASGTFTLGRVGFDTSTPVMSSRGAPDGCIVDLSFLPYRYVCVADDALAEAQLGLASLAQAQQRVFWIGEPDQTIVQDFDPPELKGDITMNPTIVQGTVEVGTELRTDYNFVSEGPAIAPDVGVTISISSGFDSVTVPADCALVLGDLRCFAGDVSANDSFTFSLIGLPTDTATDSDFTGTLIIDTDLPATNESSEGDQASDGSGGGSGSSDNNGRGFTISQTQDFGGVPGVSGGNGGNVGGDGDGDGGGDGGGGLGEGEVPLCRFCGPISPPNGPIDIESTTTVHSGLFDFLQFLGRLFGRFKWAFGGGDPHLTTLDGVAFDFHASGDYVLSRSTVDDFEVQARFSRFGPRQISWTHGFAMRAGDSILTFGDDESLVYNDQTIVKLDDEIITPTSDALTLPGDVVIRSVNSGSQFQVVWPDGTMFVTERRLSGAYRLYLPESRWGTVEGLAGDADGNTAGELVASDGAPFDYNSLEFYTIYGESWNLDEFETFFESELSDSQLLPVIPLKRFPISELAAATLAEAEATCRAEGFIEGQGLAECIFDYALTGDTRFIDGLDLIRLLWGRSVSALAELGVIEDDTTVVAPTTLRGEITTSHKIDVFRFNVDAGQSITIDSATTCTNDASFEFVLEAPSGDTIARNGISRTTRCGRIGLFDLPETGEYILRVYDSWGFTGQYALQVALPGSDAVAYELDEVGTGTIDPGGQSFHVFDVAGDDTELYFDSQACGTGNLWQLVNANEQIIRTANCFQEFTEVVDAGQYMVRVFSDDERGGNYAFRIWEAPERQDFEYVLDDSQFGELTFPTDANNWQFEITEDGTELFFDPQGCAGGLRWQLVAPDGVAEPYENCFQSFTRTVDAGTWTIRVYSVDDSFGTYRFQIWEIPERQNFDYILEDSQFGELTFPTDRQEWSFDITADGTEVYFDPQGCASGLRWRLIRPDGSAESFENCFADFSRTLDTGTWKIRVYSIDERFGTYRFRIWEIPDRENFDYVVGDTVNVVLSFPTDSEVYTFDVAADNTTLIFDGQGCNPTSQRWQLRRPDGSLVQTRNCFQDMTHTLDAGTHTLRVYTDDDRFGTFQFQVREQ